jgi:phosphoesterase RecJ-like protein
VLAPIAVRDLSASATGELLFHLAQRWNVALSLDLATCLYCCVFTDTGSFRYKSTTPAVLHVAAHLIAAGVNPWEMTSQIYESQPRARVELLRQVLNTLDYSPCGRLSIMRIEHHMLATSGATLEMADGFINHGRGVSGVEVAAQLVELDDPDHWRVSFRSRGAVDVAQLASLFGGGGGKNAAGCLMRGSPREILDQLSAALSSSLDP